VENDKIFQPAEEDLVINGKPLSHTYPDGKIVNPHYPLNPVSIDSEMKWVYFGALGGHKIYRIATENLANENLSDNQLSKQIEFFANKPKSDGFKIDKKGQIYVTDVENNAIAIATSKGYKILVQDKKLLSWPDGISIANDGICTSPPTNCNTNPIATTAKTQANRRIMF